jgi:hypothetical protein
MNKVLEYHTIIQRAALGISATLDKVLDDSQGTEQADLIAMSVRTGKAQLRVLIDQGLLIGKYLEEQEKL